MKPIVRVQKLSENAVLPQYGSAGAAGGDLYACTGEAVTSFAPGETKFIHTGIAVEIPAGYVGLIFARSGTACKRGLAPANKVGVIDCDYRGEIMVALHNHSGAVQQIEDGERIAQLAIIPYLAADFEWADTLDMTDRGTGGFGSTGKK